MNTTLAEPVTSPSTSTKDEPAPVKSLASAMMVFLAGLMRLAPSLKPPNVAPIGGMALFGGSRLPLWQAFLMQFICMAISDLILQRTLGWRGFDPWVYGSFAVYVLLGRLLRGSRSPVKIGAVSFAASTQFFLVTNFGFWLSPNGLYAPTLAGLIECYTAALPFYGFTLAGDLGFCLVLFGAYDWLASVVMGRKRMPIEEAAR